MIYDEESKTSCREFSAIYNLYVALYMSYVNKHIDVCEHVRVWSSIQLCIAKMSDTCLDVGALVFT